MTSKEILRLVSALTDVYRAIDLLHMGYGVGSGFNYKEYWNKSDKLYGRLGKVSSTIYYELSDPEDRDPSMSDETGRKVLSEIGTW